MCEGRCEVQFYDVDATGVTAKADPDNKSYCPAAPTQQQIADHLQPPSVQIGCKEADCVCVLYPNQTPTWTDWQTYDATGKELIIFVGDGISKPCKYTLTGTYQVSSCIEDGLCMKKPEGWKGHGRRRNPNRPKKPGKSGEPEKPKKHPKKKRRKPYR